MKTIHTLITTVLLTGVTLLSNAQGGMLENYLMNDCTNPDLENALVENALEWQDDLIAAAISGPSQDKIDAQRVYLKKRFETIRNGAENSNYAWLTPEYRETILATTEEEFVQRELGSFVSKYKQQALRGIQVLRTNGALNENDDMKLTIFPNPARELVTITAELSTESDYILSFIDLNGTQVAAQVEGKGNLIKHEISVIDLPAGKYLVEIVSSGGQVVTEAFVVVK